MKKIIPPPPVFLKFLLVFIFFVLPLYSCGGGGGGSDEATVPLSQLIRLKLSAQKLSATQIRLSWSVTGDVSKIAGYNLYREGSQYNPIYVDGKSASHFEDFGLKPSTNYCYSISPVDASGNELTAASDGRNACADTDSADTAMMTFDMSSSRVSGSDIIVSWKVSGDAPGLSGYRVDRNGANLTFLPSSTTSYTDSTADQNLRYCYTVTAVDVSQNELGRGEFCAAKEDREAPSVPSNITASAVSGSEVSLSWNESTDNTGVTGYRIYREGSLLTTVQGTSYTDQGLNASNRYCYQVSAFDAVGNESGVASESCVTLSDTQAPSAPSGLSTSSASATSISLSWNGSTDNTGVTGYRIYRGGSLLTAVQGMSYTDTGLSASTRYCYQVSAVDAAGNESAKTSESCASTSGSATVTQKINDTGITKWGNETDNTLTSSQPDYPGQDADYGRDKTNNDDADGHAGFKFTKIGASGEVLSVVAAEWSAVLDNVTGLMWENKTDDGGLHDKDNTYSWYEPDNSKNGGDAGMQNGGTCPEGNCDTWHFVQAVNAEKYWGKTGWRMPTRMELRSIVNYDILDTCIDIRFFPNTNSGYFWSSSPHADGVNRACGVGFSGGGGRWGNKSSGYYVRLVRSGQ